MVDLAYVFAGFFVGTIVGLTGVGGGSLMTPLLIFFFGVKPYMAVGTDLLFAAFTKLGGTISFARQRIVPWRVVGLLSAGSIPACLVTLGFLHWVGPASLEVQSLMTTTLGVALLLTAAAMLYKAIRGQQLPRHLAAADEAPQQAEDDQPRQRVAGDDMHVAQLFRFRGKEGGGEAGHQRPVEKPGRQVPDADGLDVGLHGGAHFGMMMERSL